MRGVMIGIFKWLKEINEEHVNNILIENNQVRAKGKRSISKKGSRLRKKIVIEQKYRVVDEYKTLNSHAISTNTLGSPPEKMLYE